MTKTAKGKPTELIPAWLKSVGAVENDPKFIYSLTLLTRLGCLDISVEDDWVACRFRDVIGARAVLPCGPDDRLNKHTGKWNHHYMGWPPRDALAAFARAINEVL